MDKLNLNQQFSHRLRDSMISAGFNSQRSVSGVSIHKLAEITGYSAQICRKYLRGEAIPEPLKLAEIATKLNVSAGWLLFGDTSNAPDGLDNKITISKELLHYIFHKATILYQSTFNAEGIPDYLLELIQDVSLINANEEQSRKIIDLALSSLKHLHQA